MDFLGLSLRMAASGNGNQYLPYELDGDFTQTESNAIKAALDPNVPERVDSMFNNWRVAKHSRDFFTAKRATWDLGIFSAHSAAEIATKISDYYSR